MEDDASLLNMTETKDVTKSTAHLLSVIHVGIGSVLVIVIVVSVLMILLQKWMMERFQREESLEMLVTVALCASEEDETIQLNSLLKHSNYGSESAEARLPVYDEVVTEDVFPCTSAEATEAEPVPEPERKGSLLQLAEEPLWMAEETAAELEPAEAEHCQVIDYASQEPLPVARMSKLLQTSSAVPEPVARTSKLLQTPSPVPEPVARQCTTLHGIVQDQLPIQRRCLHTSAPIPEPEVKKCRIMAVAEELRQPVPKLSERVFGKVAIPTAFS